MVYLELNYSEKDNLSPFERLFSFDFYRRVLNGMRTDTVAHLIIWILPTVNWIAIAHSGLLLTKKILKNQR